MQPRWAIAPCGGSRTPRCVTCIFRAIMAREPALRWWQALLRRARPCRGDWPPFARHRLAGVFLGGLFARLPRCGGMRRGGRRFFGPEEIVLCREALGPAHLEQVRRQCAKMLAGPPPRFTLAENFLEDYTAGVASQTLEALECALETEL